MHTVSGVFKLKEVKDLCDKLSNNGYVLQRTTTLCITYHDAEGKRALSSIGRGGNWSVQVSAEVAEKFKLKLWKDLTLDEVKQLTGASN